MSHVSEPSRKLAEISEVMADGYHFVKMRSLVEDWQELADLGNETAKEAIKMVDTFHRLCMVVKK